MPSATSSAQAARIPAWKRLGLKLKSAQDTPVAEPPQDLDTLKRKQQGTPEDVLLPKKVKRSRTEASSTSDSVTPKLVRKKSVTFTPETKVEDGDSIRQLFNSWVTEQKSQDPSFEQKNSNPVLNIATPSEVEEQIDPSLPEKERRVKRVKKSKEGEKNHSNGTVRPQRSTSPKFLKVTKPTKLNSRPFLSYLRQYSEDRPNWKFNKNHQNYIIKHVFDLEAIPSDQSHFIYEYVRGLQGAVRTRLRDAALAVKIRDMEEDYSMYMDDRENKQREYEDACNEYVATMVSVNAHCKMGYEEGVLVGLSDSAIKGRIAKRVRAEGILLELAANGGTEILEAEEEVIGDDESQKRLRMNDGSSKKVARRRKQRTMNEDVESSSSEESSDSDSTDPSPAARKLNYNSDESTSSSSSSSTSSGSEEEDDDDDHGESDEDSEEESDEGASE